MDNLTIYNKVREVPKEAQKPISGGRLKGYTDINPMWRIKVLTEQFGVCGIGWKYEIVKKELVDGANGEISAFVDINLFIKVNGEWSDGIAGTGGSMFVTKEKSGLYTSDECFKMALTDAISVACKSLGMGADVYWQGDRTKYNTMQSEEADLKSTKKEDKPLKKPTRQHLLALSAMAQEKNISLKEKGQEWTGKSSSAEWTMEDYLKVKKELEGVKVDE